MISSVSLFFFKGLEAPDLGEGIESGENRRPGPDRDLTPPKQVVDVGQVWHSAGLGEGEVQGVHALLQTSSLYVTYVPTSVSACRKRRKIESCIATRNKKLLVAPGMTTSSKDATSSHAPCY